MMGLVLVSSVLAASGAEPCCKACVAPLVKYHSVDVKHGFCGETCIKPSKYGIYKVFEKNLTLSDSDTPCMEEFTPTGTHYTEYSETVTHGVPGLLAVTLDLYGPGAVPGAYRGCKGSDNAPGPACYEGSAGALGLTETVKVNLQTVGDASGSIEFVGSGVEGFTCTDKTYTRNGQELELSDISDCLPSGVEVSKVLYCSDDDIVKVTVKDTSIPIPITATLKKTSCGSDRFALKSCTGSADPVISEPVCYQGKGGALGLTENIIMKLKSFANSVGTMDYSGDGITSFECNDRTLTKSGQSITISDSSDCLPKGIVVSAVKYCSDSDTVKITVKDESIPIPVTAVASKIACPSVVEV